MATTIGNMAVILSARTSQFSAGMKGAAGSTAAFSGAANVASVSVKGLTASLAPLLASLAPIIGVTTAIGALFKGATTGARFEQQMANVAAVMRKTSDEVRPLSALAQQLGETTQFSAAQAAEAAENFALAGFDLNKTMAALPGTLDLAAAGSLDMAQASDIAAQIMAQMGLEASELTHVADVLAKAATTANTDVLQLGEAFAKAGIVGSQAGASIEELGASLQVLANVGLRAAESGTALRNIYLRLQTGVEGVSSTLDALGISVSDANGKFKPMADIVDELNAATASMTDTQRTATLATLAGTRAAAAFSALMGAGGDKLREFEQALIDSDGAAKQVAQTKMDALIGDLTILASAAQGFAIKVFQVVSPVFRSITRGVTQFVGLVNKGFQAVTGAIAEQAIAWLGIITTAFSAIGQVVGTTFGAIAGVLSSLFAILGVSSSHFTEWGRVITISLVAVEFAFKNWLQLVEFATVSAIASVLEFAGQIQHFFTTVVPAVLVWFANNWRDIMTDVFNLTTTIFKNIANNIVEVIKNIPGLITGAVDFADLWTPLTDGFKATLSELPDIADRQMGDLERAFKDESKRLGDALGGDLSTFIEERMGEIDAQAKGIRDLFSGAFEVSAGDLPEIPVLSLDESSKSAIEKFGHTPVAAVERGTVAAFSAEQRAGRNQELSKVERNTATAATEQKKTREAVAELVTIARESSSNSLAVVSIP